MPAGVLIAVALVAAAAVGATIFSLAPAGIVVRLVLVVLWFALPGAVLAFRLYRGHPGATGAALLLGPSWGFALGSLTLLAFWAAGWRHPAILAAAPVVAAALTWAGTIPVIGVCEPPRFTRRDAVAACGVLLLVPLVVVLPYRNVGVDVPDGRAYRAYFTADFVWKMAVVAEVSKGELPPRNQFLRAKPLHYYWTPHLISAAEYRALSRSVRLDQMLLVNSVLLGLAFVAFLYAFARQFVSSATAAALGCAAAVLCGSYEGLEQLIVVWRRGIPLEALRIVNIDAVTRWFYESLPVDGLHRLLLYQPQHHAMAYAVGLSAVLLVVQTRKVTRPALMAVVGVLLGASVLLSAFSALMVTAMAALYVLVRLVAERAWRAVPACAIAGALPLAAAAGAAILLEYVDRSAGSSGVFEIIANPLAFHRVLVGITLNFGAVLVLGLAGLAWGLRRQPLMFAAPGIVVAVSFFFYFFVNVPDVQYVYVGWRAGHFLLIAGAALCGAAFAQIVRLQGGVRVAALAIAGLLLAAALPTTIIDIYNTQDIDNRLPGPGFNWTTILTHDELEALEWIRTMTPPGAIVQVEPHVRQNYTWAYIPAFAQRRLAAGLPISMVPLRPYEEASAKVREVYTATDARQAYERASRLRIDYLVVGPPEREAYPELETLLDAHPELFQPVFGNGTMRIYFVEGGFRRPLG